MRRSVAAWASLIVSVQATDAAIVPPTVTVTTASPAIPLLATVTVGCCPSMIGQESVAPKLPV